MDWNKFLNKKVKIVQKDNFVKFGTVTKFEDGFLTLVYDNGETYDISVDFVGLITEMPR